MMISAGPDPCKREFKLMATGISHDRVVHFRGDSVVASEWAESGANLANTLRVPEIDGQQALLLSVHEEGMIRGTIRRR